MDHQQNFEYNDPNSFGFMSTFGNDNYLMSQQGQPQHLNGKSIIHSASLPLQSFDPGNTVSQFITQPTPMMFHLSEPITPSINQAPLYPTSLDYQLDSTQSELNINSQKDPMFSNVENPSPTVPNNIIEQSTTSNDAIVTTLQQEESISSQVEQDKLTNKDETCVEKSQENVFSPEQNNMMKALGVVRKEILISASGSKKRRRILQLNDEEDSDDENELKKELLQSTPEMKKVEDEVDTEDSSPDSESDDDPAFSNDPEALKARSLLKSAVIIQGPANKKRKKRVLESDEEDEIQTSIDDIGLSESNENENENENDELYVGDIVLSETIVEEKENSKPPNLTDDGFVIPAPPPPVKSEIIEDKQPEINSTPENETSVENVTSVKLEDDASGTNTEGSEVDPSLNVEAILENIKPMADDDEFFKTDDKSDDSDCQFISNEEYFGTPDTTKHQPAGRKRGPRPGFKRKQRPSSTTPRKRSMKYEKDFVEGSSESEDTTYSESTSDSSDSSCEEVKPRGKPAMKKSPIIVQTKTFSVTRVPIKKKIVKRDRFYDRSRDIPNDVYFGDVKVPLHVLHTRWDSDVESSGSETESYTRRPPSKSHFKSIHKSSRSNFGFKVKPSYTIIEQQDDPKLATLKEFVKMSGIKINYTRLFDCIRSTDEKCHLIRRILAQKGMQGEPTIAKCKQLRLELQAKRESAELDKSVIINTEGRTRRATRNLTAMSSSSEPSTSSATIQPETLQTLSKIRRVVDSDSE